jgi:hypothetical protein
MARGAGATMEKGDEMGRGEAKRGEVTSMRMMLKMMVRKKEDLANMLVGWCGIGKCASKVRYDGLCVLWVSEWAQCAARWGSCSSWMEVMEKGALFFYL